MRHGRLVSGGQPQTRGGPAQAATGSAVGAVAETGPRYPADPTDDAHKQQVFDGLANALSAKMLDLSACRVRSERMQECRWHSTSPDAVPATCASLIGERIFERVAPIPDVTPSPDRNSFLHEVSAVIEGMCNEVGARLA